MKWSKKQFKRSKEYKYLSFSLLKEESYNEIIFCSSDASFYEFLNYMNCNFRHFKFLSEYREDLYIDMSSDSIRRKNVG